ncbi:hypothetical protein PMAYCL1PPCAC_19730, partial [Pristionchus mayeri]
TPKNMRVYSVFLLNNVIVDFISAAASMLGTVRMIEGHDRNSLIIIYLGPCTFMGSNFCRICQVLHVHFVLQSTILLLLSFAYRLYVLSTLFSSKRRPTRAHIWFLCIITNTLVA